MKNICYNCGDPIDEDDKTKEHVPAKNLYQGFGEEYKINLITVPACSKCNNIYSKIDQELRDALAVINDDVEAKKELTSKGVRSILRRSNWKDRTHFNHEGKVIAVNFNYEELQQLHIKNFKALFFLKYAFPVPEDFEIAIIADGDTEKIESAGILYNYLFKEKEFKHSGHPEIFKYILKDITLGNNEDEELYESEDFDQLIAIAAILIYHNEICAIVLAGKEEFIESCKP